MLKMDKRRLAICAALCVLAVLALAAASNAAWFGLVKSRGHGATGPAVRQSVMVFPFDKDADATVSEDMGQTIAVVLVNMLSESKSYVPLIFDERLTPVKRAHDDQLLKDSDIKGPYFDKAKAGKLAELFSVDYYIVGSVESYTFDKDKKTADIVLKADLVSARTGKLSHEFMVPGSAAQGAQDMDEQELQSIAGGKAVEALCQKVLESAAADAKALSAPTSKPKPKGKS